MDSSTIRLDLIGVEVFLILSTLMNISFSQTLNLFVVLFLAIDIVPIIILAIVSFFGRKVQSLFNYDFGPRWQMYIGGLGAFIHEMLQVLVAFITGHAMSDPHSVVIDCFRNHRDLTDIDHYWTSHNLVQEAGDFLVGVIPFYCLSAIIYYIQKFLMGDPWNSIASSVTLSSFTKLSAVQQLFKNDFFSSFDMNGFSVVDIIFLIAIILLVSSGYNFSTDELHYATRGVIVWTVFIFAMAIVLGFTPWTSLITAWSYKALSFGIFIFARALFYLLVVTVIMIPFAVINKISVARELMHSNK